MTFPNAPFTGFDGMPRQEAYHGMETPEQNLFQRQATLDHLNAVAGHVEGIVERQGGLRDVLAQCAFPDEVRAELERILDKMGQPGPQSVGDENNPEAAYMTQVGYDDTTRYSVNPKTLQHDTDYVEMLLSITPAMPDAWLLKQIRKTLQAYGWSGNPVEMGMHQYWKSVRESPVNQMTSTLGRMALTVGAGALAAINGFIALRTGTFSLAPVGYGIAALWAARPDLFQGQARRAVGDAYATVQKLPFQRYGIEGQDWSAFLQNHMGQDLDDRTQELLGIMKQRFLAPDEAQELVESIAPQADTPAHVRAAIVQMVKSGDVRSLVKSVQGITNPDVQEIVTAYAREGAWRMPVPPQSQWAQPWVG